MRFVKMQGAGNDFVLVETGGSARNPDNPEQEGEMRFAKMQGGGNDYVLAETDAKGNDWAKLAVAICDRHFGVGADGLLLLMPSGVADFRMRIFNADGSESTACGNGLRCMVKYFIDGRPEHEADGEITAETGAGTRRARLHSTNGGQARIEVDMGRPGIGHAATPVDVGRGQAADVDIMTAMKTTIAVDVDNVDGGDYDVSLVSMGNPHAVHFTETPVADFPLEEVGYLMEHHQAFADSVNFEIVNVTDRGRVEARVWERGVGGTLACGSGACAIGVAGRLLGTLDQPVDVKLPGGVLRVDWDGSNGVFLSGPAETVFTGEWP